MRVLVVGLVLVVGCVLGVCEARAARPFTSVDRVRWRAESQDWTVGANAVQELIARVVGRDKASVFVLSPISPPSPRNFAISTNGTNVVLYGATGSSLATALGHYLKYYCNATVAWSGNKVAVPVPLPQVDGVLTMTSDVALRFHLNTCTHSYSLAWWGWEEWEQHIDWMAVSGVNTVLAETGQEFVWLRVFTALGFSQDDILSWFVGPAFLAWGRMGNIRSYGGPLPLSFIHAQHALQQRILARLRSLSITAVLPAFAGHVPASFPSRFPNANVTTLPTWAGFNATLSAGLVLDPSDRLFANISAAILREQIAEYNGTDHAYSADTYNEMVPSSNDPAFLKAQSSAVYQSYAAVDPQAVWVIQGWMFSFDKSFWQPAQTKAYLSGVPDTGMIVLDLNAFADPIWKATDSFYGKDFIWCMIDDGGQRPGMFGGLQILVDGVKNATETSGSIVGVGTAPEGIFLNYVSYELLLEQGWESKGAGAGAGEDERDHAGDVPTWVEKYVDRRYGLQDSTTGRLVLASTELHDAWELLLSAAYSTGGEQSGHMFSSRPSLTMGSSTGWCNVTAMTQALRLFVVAAPRAINIAPFRFDLVDLTRQVLTNLFEDLYQSYTGAFHANDTVAMTPLGSAMVALVEDMDVVLATHAQWTVGQWVWQSRQACGGSEDVQDLCESNARHLITIWGPNGELNGYSTRHLSGLNKDYHAKRWELFVNRTQAAVQRGEPFDQAQFDTDCFETIEKAWANDIAEYPHVPTGDMLSEVRRVVAKYLGEGTLDSLRSRYDVFTDSDGDGGVYDNLRYHTRDLGHMDFVCSVDPNCGGFNSDGYAKPADAQVVDFPGSVLLMRK